MGEDTLLIDILGWKYKMDGTYSARGRNKKAQRILVGRPKGRDYLEDQGMGGSIILNGILEK
jgi:hypothetical protein